LDLASGSDQGEAHWHHQLPASLKALVPVLLAISGQPSQRRHLVIAEEGEEEEEGEDSSGSPGGDRDEVHWRHRLPASSKALVPVPLAVSRQLRQRRHLVVAEEEEDEEGEDSPGSPGGNRDEVHWCHWLPASSKALVPTLLAVSG